MATICDKEKAKETWIEGFETVFDKITGKDVEKNEKDCDTLEVKEIFCD